MLYIVTYFDVQPNFADEGARSIVKYLSRCSTAAGLVQAEALRERSRSNRFVVLQTWSGEQTFQAHENGEQIRDFREELTPLESGPYDQRVHEGFALTPAAKAIDTKSLFVVSHIDVPPPRKGEAEILLKKISAEAVQDAGNKRYDVLQQTSRPNHFTSISVWGNDSYFFAHMAETHTREFRQALGPMAGGLYDERLYGVLE